MSDLLTPSRARVARACKREHHLQYDEGWRSVRDVETLHFGTLIDKAMEPWWLGWKLPPEERLAVALAALEVEPDPFVKARAQVLVTGYHLRWQAEPYEVLGVEHRFRGPLMNPDTGMPSRVWRLGGKMDVRVLDLRTGLKWVIERKTSSEDVSPGSDYVKRLRLDAQISIYLDGSRFLGDEAAGCLYDIIKKPGQRPFEVSQKRKVPETADEYRARVAEVVAEEPSKYFVRAEVVRLEQEVDDARRDVWELAKEIREGQLAGRFPRNPDACVRFGRTCAFFGVCTGEASLDDPRLFHRVADVHPELAGDDDEARPKEEASL